MSQHTPHTQVAIIGAGPVGLEVAVELKKAGVDYLHFDKGQIASTIQWFPEGMTFFSSTERIAIAGLPIQTTNQTKATKEQYIAYLRSVAMAFDLKVRTYEEVTAIERQPTGGFLLRTRNNRGEHTFLADNIVLATGDMAHPRTLGIEGENLPHVSHYFRDPHTYFGQKVLIVGGKNSAVEAALRCYFVGAEVTLSYRRDTFNDRSVKYWLLPELKGRIKRGEIDFYPETVPTRITPTHVTLQHNERDETYDVAADFVLLLVGYTADMSLFEMAGVELTGPAAQAPTYDENTMQTNVPGLYVAGTATAGSQVAGFRVFIENCHIHARRIAAALTGATPPPAPEPIGMPES